MKFRDKRRKHRHWRVTITFRWGEKFIRVFSDREKAEKSAERQSRSPMVRSVDISPVNFSTLPWVLELAKKEKGRRSRKAKSRS